MRLSGSDLMLCIVERLMNWRSHLTGIASGNQGMFVTRNLFECIGGFPRTALMEDIAISGKPKAAGRPVGVLQKLITSSRRWDNNGMLRIIFLMWKLRLLYFLGVEPDRLARMHFGGGS